MLNPGANSRKRKSARGQATVELALVGIFLVLLIVGVADVARIYSEHLAAVHAAGVAARWATLSPNSRSCSPYADVQAVVDADLNGTLPGAVASCCGSDPTTVQVTINYNHEFLFGLIKDVPTNFTASATMPGAFATATGTPYCPSTPFVPTSTPAPSATATLSPTPAPTATCAPHGFSNPTFCRVGSGSQLPWKASITVVGYRAGDSVSVTTCANPDGTNCHGGGSMSCNSAGNCTFVSANSDQAKSTDYVKFTLSPGSGSCSIPPSIVGPFGGNICP